MIHDETGEEPISLAQQRTTPYPKKDYVWVDDVATIAEKVTGSTVAVVGPYSKGRLIAELKKAGVEVMVLMRGQSPGKTTMLEVDHLRVFAPAPDRAHKEKAQWKRERRPVGRR